MNKIRSTYWVLFFILLGFGLRLLNLSFQPLWGDEGWSFYFAAQSLPELLSLTAIDIHPPLYYILLKGWLSIIGYGPEEARFFSIAVGTALIPVLGVLGQRLLDQRVGVAAAAIVAVMPMAIYYSQEVRMYELVTLLGALSAYFYIRVKDDEVRFGGPRGRRATGGGRYLTAYIITITAALYTMYYAVFIFLFQLLYSLLSLIPQIRQSTHNPRPIRESARLVWLEFRPFIIVGLLYLPWVIYAGTRTANYIINKRAVEKYLPLDFIRFFGDHFVAFSVGHLSSNLRPYVWVALIFVIVASVGFITTLSAKRKSYLYLYFFTPLLLEYAINQFFPFNPPYFERTLLIAAPAYWLFMAVGLVRLWDWHYLLAGGVAIVMLTITAVSLMGFYSVPRYPHEDYRPLLRDIAARATPEDTLLASYQWQLGFYHAYLPTPGPRFFTVPGWGEGWAGEQGQAQRTKDLAHLFATSSRLWFPAHQALGHFWEDEAEADITRLGYPALLQWYGPQIKLTLAGSAQPSLVKAATANFDNRLTLLEASIGNGKYEAGRGIVPVELTWQKEKSLGSEHRLSLRVADTMGRTWGIRDSYPRAGQAFFTDLHSGDTLVDRHGLLIPAGTPPGLYRLLLSVRRVSDDHPLDLLDAQGQPLGVELLLAEVEVVDPNPPVGPAALPIQIATEATFGQEARLVGYSLGHGPFKAGEILPLNLFWESLTNAPGPLTTVAQLQDMVTGQPVFSLERAPLRPTSQWQRHTLLRDPYDLSLPPTLPPGVYQLVIALLTPEQTRLTVNGRDQLLLTVVETIDRPHNFEAPTPQITLEANFSDQARLAGVDLPQATVKAGGNLSLTLYWQALAPLDRSWKVFVHLVDRQDKIVSQQDQIPGAGQFPTTSWLPNEYLVDSYNLAIPADTPPGRQAYRLEIGLYDASGRLSVVEAGEVVDDHLVLDKWPISIE
jgi:4-amino-4-deoxy-L-arabinose transferase-like glycosyltransferase